MKKYKINWGPEEKTVYAGSPQEVWAQFAEGHDLAMRHPHLHEPKIVEVEEPKFVSPPASAPPAAVTPAATSKK